MSKAETKGRFDFLPLLFIVAACALGILEFFPPEYSADETVNKLISGCVTRLLGGGLFIFLALRQKWKIWRLLPNGYMSLVAVLPAFAVVINNFPLIGLFSGNAYLTKPIWQIILFGAYCLSIGLFEEFAFRGVFFLTILSTRHRTKAETFWVTVLSSVLFGGVHLFNLLAGSGFGPTVMQMGYSFLIGGMCAIVLLRTRSIWLPVLLHTLFDFGGYLIPMLGDGVVWDTATVVLTAVIATAAAIYMTWLLLKIPNEQIEFLFSDSLLSKDNQYFP